MPTFYSQIPTNLPLPTYFSLPSPPPLCFSRSSHLTLPSCPNYLFTHSLTFLPAFLTSSLYPLSSVPTYLIPYPPFIHLPLSFSHVSSLPATDQPTYQFTYLPTTALPPIPLPRSLPASPPLILPSFPRAPSLPHPFHFHSGRPHQPSYQNSTRGTRQPSVSKSGPYPVSQPGL